MTALPPGSVIGILGGGQLGRMLAMAAARLGYRAAIYAPEQESIAAQVSDAHYQGEWTDLPAVDRFVRACDVVTFEWENVPVPVALAAQKVGTFFPGLSSLEQTQDRLREKALAASLGISVPRFAEVSDEVSLNTAVQHVGTPAILKTARDGYDGKGQVRLATAAGSSAAWEAIGRQRAILEQRITFLGEFSVLLVRDRHGSVRHWEVPRNIHEDGILAESRLPAPGVWDDQIRLAKNQSEAIARYLDHVGVMAVEFFATADGPVFNEIAPRVHNSGHWTTDGAVTCQFENHIRAICGLPLGDTATRAQPVVMRNLIGDAVDEWLRLLEDPGCRLHIYGKGAPRPGRKMGHATWVGTTPR